jgi:hypothetical protein
MTKLKLMALAALPMFATPLAAQSDRILLTSCRQGECGWMRIVSSVVQSRNPNGILRRITVRRGTSLNPDFHLPSRASEARIEWRRLDSVEYAFCSRRRPAYAFPDDGRLIVHFLDPFDLGGYQFGSAAHYFRFCHGRNTMPSPRAMRRLGYRPGTRSEQIEAHTPEVMTRF